MSPAKVNRTREPFGSMPQNINGALAEDGPRIAVVSDANVAEDPLDAKADSNTNEGGQYARAVATAKGSARSRPLTPSDIVRMWKAEGHIVRVPTGFPTLDEACRGGLPIPWRLMIVGAPSAGKTALAMILAHRVEAAGLCVGILGVDEDPEDQNARLVQRAGFTIAQCERRDPEVLDRMADALSSLRVRFYDSTHTIESAADDLGAWATAEGRKAAFVVDTVQTIRCAASVSTKGPRELVESNAAALRAVGAKHKLLMMMLSEANRGAYRSDDAADTANDMASGAESRAIEFMAQTLMMLRTPKAHADVVHVRVPKNRKGAKAGFEFFLRLDRDRHELTECADPTSDPSELAERDDKRRKKNVADLGRMSAELARIVRSSPAMNERGLRTAVKLAGLTWGVETLEAVKGYLSTKGANGLRLVNRGGRKAASYCLEPIASQGEA
jgi:RecA/RadA recombinase